MTRDESGTSEAMTATLAALTRGTPWRPVGELRLRGDARHPQGMTRVGSSWWVSTVDVEERQGYVLVFDDYGDLLEHIPVGDHERFHPGGMDFDGEACWIAAADYRPDSTTTVYRLEPGGEPERVFDVDDHIGALVRCGDGDLVGWSWGSRRFSRWSVDGKLRSTRVNPSFFVDLQDGQWIDTGHLLCGGVARVDLSLGRDWLGGIGLLSTDTLEMEREVPFPAYSHETGRVATHNPICAEVRGGDLIVHLLPDDRTAAMLSYSTPLVGTV